MNNKELTDSTLEIQTKTGVVWNPRRPSPVLSETQTDIDSLKNQMATLTTTVGTPPAAAEPPVICTDLGAVESPYKTANGQLRSLVSVSFVNTDPNFASADIYFTGYHGSSTPQFIASGTESPISFLCETTLETVTVTVVSLSSGGLYLPMSEAPTTTVALDGVASPPPPPSIHSGLIITPLGYSFSFNAEEGLLADIIDGYKIYRNTSNTSVGAVQIQYIKQVATNTGAIEVQDVQSLNNTVDYFYFVSAVNTSGLESTLTAVGLAVVGAFAQQVTGVSATESPYKTQAGQLVSLVDVSFTPDEGDAYFKSVEIWFTGFNGSAVPQLMAEGDTSPVSFLCETTHEVVTITVVAISNNGIASDFAGTTWHGNPVTWRSTWDTTVAYSVNDGVVYSSDDTTTQYYIAKAGSTGVTPGTDVTKWTAAPICSVALDGVLSAPPPPSINQAQVALLHDTGWQFSFNVLGGLLQDLIDGYWIYHSLTDTTPVPPAGRFQYIKQGATNLGVCTVQEVTDEQLYYWVSAVNIGGMESTLTPVPVTFVDPGDPAPPAPPDVVANTTLVPSVSLNGWSHGVHVSDYRNGLGMGDSDEYAIAYGVARVNGHSYPKSGYGADAAIDGNDATYAWGAAEHCSSSFGCVWTFSGATLPAGATVSSQKLHLISEVKPTSGFAGHASLWYSLNAGSTWTQVYRVTSIRSKQDDVVTLPGGQDITQVQVMACCFSHDDAASLVYSINADVTYSAAAGPPKVTGVRASMASGNVKIDWTASNVTITGYEVYRAVHGAGYPTSHLKASPSSGTTTWTDTTAHDGFYDYFVIALNAAGWSGPSNPANIMDANGMIYTGGATVDSLQPAEPGAEVTVGKSITVLTDRTADNIAATAFKKWAAEEGADVTAGKSLDILADGTYYKRLLYVDPDHTLHSSSGINPQGSINPQGVTANGSLTGVLVGGVPKIRFAFTEGYCYLPDGTVVTVTATPEDLTTFAGYTVATSTAYCGNIAYNWSTTGVSLQEWAGVTNPQRAAFSWSDGLVPINYAINITTPDGGGSGGGGGGGGGCYSGNTRINTPTGTISFREIEEAGGKTIIRNALGDFEAELVVHPPVLRVMIDMGDDEFVTRNHMVWDVNHKCAVAASVLFINQPRYMQSQKVYNLMVRGTLPAHHWYVLANGTISSNLKIMVE